MSTIREYLSNQFEVEGKTYKDLSQVEKEDFLKYEIALIDLDLDQNDPKIIEIFKRLNRTFYALSAIEKMSSEYGSSEFMLIAKLLCGELRDEEVPMAANVQPLRYKHDPNVSKEFTDWANDLNIGATFKVILETIDFSKYEVQRQVHLMFTLNLMGSFLMGVYARNEQVQPLLDVYAEALENRDDLIRRVDQAANWLIKLKLPLNGAWYSKSNAFSLLVALDAVGEELKNKRFPDLRKRLMEFFSDLPPDYALAAKEAVNNKRERLLRNTYLIDLLKA